MLIDQQIPINSELDDWAVQSEFWIAEMAKLQKPRRIRERNSNPLILTGHGTSMRIDCGTLLIKEGFTHYPQKQIEHRYFAGDLGLPRTILLLDGSGSLSFDVLSWLGEQGVSLIRIKWDGSIVIAVNANGYAANQAKVDWQRETRSNREMQMAFASDLISLKLENSIATLNDHFANSLQRQKAIARAGRGIAQLSETIPDMAQVRGIEGEFASLYFAAWKQLKLQWSESKRHPIADHWKLYRCRGSVRECKAVNYGATDPINAMLNYAYIVKLAQMQIVAIGEGYDPTIGIMHNGRRGKPSYIFDIMEPERPRVDAILLEFISGRTFSGADFVLGKDGVCRLSPQLARTIAGLVI